MVQTPSVLAKPTLRVYWKILFKTNGEKSKDFSAVLFHRVKCYWTVLAHYQWNFLNWYWQQKSYCWHLWFVTIWMTGHQLLCLRICVFISGAAVTASCPNMPHYLKGLARQVHTRNPLEICPLSPVPASAPLSLGIGWAGRKWFFWLTAPFRLWLPQFLLLWRTAARDSLEEQHL